MCPFAAHTEVCVSIRRASFYFCFFIKHHYGCDGFFGETVSQKCLLHLPFVCTIARYSYEWNVHRMSIKIEHRNLETRQTRNDFFSPVRNYLLPLSLKVLRHKEREAQSLYSGFFICPTNTCGTRHKGPREQAKTNRLPLRQVSSQLC